MVIITSNFCNTMGAKMNFQTMDYFVAVAEEKSFTKAAERLSVTQQTLSANIAAAEKELGSKLLLLFLLLSLFWQPSYSAP